MTDAIFLGKLRSAHNHQFIHSRMRSSFTLHTIERKSLSGPRNEIEKSNDSTFIHRNGYVSIRIRIFTKAIHRHGKSTLWSSITPGLCQSSEFASDRTIKITPLRSVSRITFTSCLIDHMTNISHSATFDGEIFNVNNCFITNINRKHSSDFYPDFTTTAACSHYRRSPSMQLCNI